MTPLVFVVAAAATYSLTLLLVCDKITDRPREALLTLISGHGFGGPSLMHTGGVWVCTCGITAPSVDEVLDHVHDAREEIVQEIPMSKRAAVLYLLRCYWCASLYVAVPVAWSGWCFGDRAWWFVPAAALAFRGFTGALATYANPRT